MPSQDFTTPGTDTFAVPAGVTSITVKCWGGGEGGSYGTEDAFGGQGGYGGGFAQAVIAVTPEAEYDVIVGAGGDPLGTLQGGDSYFDDGSEVLAAGGNAFGGTSQVGDVTNAGGSGGASTDSDPWDGGGGGGGGGDEGTGGNAVGASAGFGGDFGGGDGGNGGSAGAGSAGSAPGGGGGGGSGSGGSWAGEVGGDGRVLIEWTLSPRAGEIERPRTIYSQPQPESSPVIVRANTAQISSGTGAKTLLQIVAASNHRIVVRSVSVSFEGINRSAAPVQVVVMRQADAGTMSSLTLVKDCDSDDETVQTTAQHTATAEPSSGDVLERVLVHPRGGRGDLGPFFCKGGGRLGVVVTAGESVDCIASAVIEE